MCPDTTPGPDGHRHGCTKALHNDAHVCGCGHWW